MARLLSVDAAFTKNLPKVELHAHLTGSISVSTLHAVWQTRKAKDPAFPLEDPIIALPLEKVDYDVSTFFPLFDSYIYELCNSIEAIRYATMMVLQSFQEDGVCYLELRTTPRESLNHNTFTKDAYVEAVLDCIALFGRLEMSTYLILSIDRRNTEAQAMATVDLAIKYKDMGVVGVDLCGNPIKGDVTTFRAAFAKARAAGLRVTLHFAEVPESSSRKELETLLEYQPDRLGHVINVPVDLRRKIADRHIGLELCLSCNVHAKLIPGSFADHHFGYWKDKECPISLCTDDVGIFGSSTSNEYLLAAQHFKLDQNDLVCLSEKAVDSIFAGQLEKDRMKHLLSEFRAGLCPNNVNPES